MSGRPDLPERSDAYWQSLARRNWRRVKWRRTTGEASTEVCAVYGTPIHRPGTYYLRPAYSDGEIWISQRAYEEMVRRTRGAHASRSYGLRGDQRDES